jgi:hypothetical protein
MKKIITIMLMMCSCIMLWAQDETFNLTVYKEFKPGIIHMANGKDLVNPLLNIFMKQSTLLYMSGNYAKEANMDNVLGVDFDDRKYIKINGELAYLVDSIGANRLYCVTLIDIDAYKSLQKNNVNISNLSLGDQISYSTIDMENRDSIQMPVIERFYYLFDGKYIKVHEREISRLLPKEKRRLYKTIISQDGFSWIDKQSLLQLLKAISTLSSE